MDGVGSVCHNPVSCRGRSIRTLFRARVGPSEPRSVQESVRQSRVSCPGRLSSVPCPGRSVRTLFRAWVGPSEPHFVPGSSVRVAFRALVGPSETRSVNSMAALTPDQSAVMNRTHLTKPHEFPWFGCIDTKSEHDNEQDASHETISIPMAWLH